MFEVGLFVETVELKVVVKVIVEVVVVEVRVVVAVDVVVVLPSNNAVQKLISFLS